jgi:TolA-binding protein
MDNRKFEKLIDLIINENEEQARELFHDIVVDKSREIYESIMEEEMMDDDMYEEMGGQVGDLLDEISAEEEGMMEDEEEDLAMDAEMDMADADDSFELDVDDMEDTEEGEEVEDAVIRIEDKLDQLMTEFESIMGGDADMDDEVAVDSEETEEELTEGIIDDKVVELETKLSKLQSEVDHLRGWSPSEKQFYQSRLDLEAARDQLKAHSAAKKAARSNKGIKELEEAVQLQKVSVTHGDNGVQTKSTVAANSGQAGMASKPVKASTTTETGRAAPAVKDVDGASKFKNAPGQKKQELTSAPKPVTKDGSAYDRSPVAKK